MAFKECPPRGHDVRELRRRDRYSAQYQCVECLAPVGRRHRLELDELAELPRWQLRPRARARGNSRARRYREFLASAGWQEQRLRVLERDGWKCQGFNCGADLRPPARATVHHRSYRPVLSEVPDAELAASCPRCNLQERIARITRARPRPRQTQ